MGTSAKNQHTLNYKNTIYGFRDLLGRKFTDPYVQQEMKLLPFNIVLCKNDNIGIQVTYLTDLEEEKEIISQSSIRLQTMRENTFSHLNK